MQYAEDYVDLMTRVMVRVKHFCYVFGSGFDSDFPEVANFVRGKDLDDD